MLDYEKVFPHLGHSLIIEQEKSGTLVLVCIEDSLELQKYKKGKERSNCCPACDLVFSGKHR